MKQEGEGYAWAAAADTDLAWAAGIIDGEGAISMTKAKPGTNRRKTLSFQVRITVQMTHKPTIQKLHKLFGGSFTFAKARDPVKHRPTYRWYVGDLMTVDILSLTLPYLVTKKEQALVVLEFRKKCFQKKPTGKGATCDKKTVRMRHRYFTRLEKLNRKGPVLCSA